MIATTTETSEQNPPVSGASPSRQAQLQQSLNQACLAARVLADTRGQDVLVLDLTGVTSIVDYFVVATGTSPRQMRAMAEEVHKVLKHVGSKRIGFEGEESNSWLLQDYGDVVIHLFSQDARKLYDLEHLWADAPRVEWTAIAPAVAPRI